MKHKFLIVFLFFVSTVIGQDQFRREIIQYSPENGLSGRFANYTFKDSRGLIWIGTQHGLNRFDGRNFKIFDEDTDLPFNQVMEIYEDQENYLWLYRSCFSKPKDYCTKKLVFFHAINQKVLSFEERFGNSAPFIPAEIQHISSSKSGKWFCIRTIEKTYKWSLETGFTEIPGNDFNSAPDVFDILEDGRMGATLQTDSIFMYYLIDNQGKVIYKDVLAEASSELFFYKTFPPLKRKISERDASRNLALINNCITYTDSLGVSYRLLVQEDGKLKKIPFPIDLLQVPKFSNRHMFVDESNNTYWVANRSGVHFVRLEKNSFNNVKLKDDYSMFIAIKSFQEKMHLIGTYGSIYFGELNNYNSEELKGLDFLKFQEINLSNKKLSEASIEEIQNAKSFFLYWRKMIAITADNQIKLVPLHDISDYPFRNGQCIQKVKDELFIGTRDGLFIYSIKDQVLKKVEGNNGFSNFSDVSVHYIHKIDSDLFWICTNEGIFKFSRAKGILQHYNADQKGNFELPAYSVYHLTENGDGTFWLATRNGFIHWAADRTQALDNGKRYKVINKEKGMPDNLCNAIYKDDYGYLWVSTIKGIVQYDISNERIKVYDHKDGLEIEYFLEYGHDQDEGGNIMFGGLGGFVQFNPTSFKDANFDEVKIPLILVELEQYDSEKQDFEDKTQAFFQNDLITLAPEGNLFTVRVAISDFRSADQHQFEYKIPGYIEEWQSDASNLIRISGLPYGRHNLLVRGKLPDGIYSSEILKLPILVLKPFYLKWWFIISCIFLFLLAIWIWYSRRIYKLKSQQQALETKVAERTAQIAADKKIIEKQTEELLELDEVKSRFFANVSHELRTPITLIKGPINQVLKTDELNSRSKKLLTKAEESTSKLLSLVNEILHLTRLDAQKMGLDESNVVFYDFLRKIISSFESVAESKAIEISFVFQPKDHLQIKLDSSKFEKIINNLLTNAFKFTPAGGMVRVEVRNVDEFIQLAIKDNGRGIPKEDLPRVFDRFYQASSNKKAEGGFGIGLSLCKEYVKLMNGKIWVESEVEVGQSGTIFFIQIPRIEVIGQIENKLPKKEQLTLIKENSSATINSEKAKILLVEDNADLRDYVQFLLVDHYEVFAVEHGQKALEFIEKDSHLDLIISDLMMPVMDGFQFLNALKTNDQFRAIPIIMLTARADVSDRLKALRIGVDDYITKPFEADELLVRIENLLHNASERKKWFLKEQKSPDKVENEGPKLSKHDAEWLEKLESIIETRLKDFNFKMEDLANDLAISRRQLFRKVKELTGLTPKQMLTESRLQYARQLLESGKVSSIKATAYEAGFQTPGHFSELYRNRFGKKPSELLK